MSQAIALDLPLEKIRAYCATQPIERLSKLAPEFEGWLRPYTEIGFIVDYAPGACITLLDMAKHEIDLSEILGRGVSLHTSRGLIHGSIENYIESAMLVYEKNT